MSFACAKHSKFGIPMTEPMPNVVVKEPDNKTRRSFVALIFADGYGER
jgi:hypothetical protein